MARVCDYCGKGTAVGRSITRKGLSKAKGGVGLKTTGVSKRKFKPNVQRIRVLEGTRVVRVRICTRCLKAGRVKKPVT